MAIQQVHSPYTTTGCHTASNPHVAAPAVKMARGVPYANPLYSRPEAQQLHGLQQLADPRAPHQCPTACHGNWAWG